jgi:hypothetical protein
MTAPIDPAVITNLELTKTNDMKSLRAVGVSIGTLAASLRERIENDPEAIRLVAGIEALGSRIASLLDVIEEDISEALDEIQKAGKAKRPTPERF